MIAMREKINKNEALVLGVILGDGHLGIYSNSYQVVISGNLTDDKEFLLDVIKPILEKLFKKHVGTNKRLGDNTLDLKISSKEVLFVINKRWKLPIGKKKEISIASKFLDIPDITKNIISGFFATDGSLVITNNNGIMYPRIEFQNISKKLLEQVQKILSNSIGLFGGGLYKMIRKNPTRIVYRLQYNGKRNLLKFKNKIGFINPKHKSKFIEYKLEMLV